VVGGDSCFQRTPHAKAAINSAWAHKANTTEPPQRRSAGGSQAVPLDTGGEERVAIMMKKQPFDGV
jgi:hypothetical protein